MERVRISLEILVGLLKLVFFFNFWKIPENLMFFSTLYPSHLPLQTLLKTTGNTIENKLFNLCRFPMNINSISSTSKTDQVAPNNLLESREKYMTSTLIIPTQISSD
jgi:hypothetical protein